MKNDKKLTKQAFWENYWDKNLEGREKKRTSILVEDIYRVFNKYLPKNSDLSILEIGGAPGEYLIHMTRNFGYSANSMDYSEVGNKMTLENFEKVGLEVELFEQDLFAEKKTSKLFDIVYSLGFIEHFEDTNNVVRKHLDYLKPGGILLLGVPNLTGVYGWFLKHLSPSYNETHNLKSMNLKNWDSFESEFNLKPIFKGYIGGFEPIIIKKMDHKSLFNQILLFIVKVLVVIFSLKRSFLRSFNSRYWSGYIIGIYRFE